MVLLQLQEIHMSCFSKWLAGELDARFLAFPRFLKSLESPILDFEKGHAELFVMVSGEPEIAGNINVLLKKNQESAYFAIIET
jgi:hypothetical protein